MDVYRTLRKEGVIFPKREVKNQYMIKFDGKKSPIFETIEGTNIYEVRLTQEPNKVLCSNGTYKVKETDLFSNGPIVEKKKKKISERQKQSKNGYANPRVQDSGNTNLRMANTRSVRQHSYYQNNPSSR